MKPDRKRADKFEKEINKFGVIKINEVIGLYQHIIQTYKSTKNYEELLSIKDILDKKYDCVCMIYGGINEHNIEVQFYPIFV